MGIEIERYMSQLKRLNIMIDIIYNQLLITILWSETDIEGEPLDGNFTPKDIEESSRVMLRQLCSEFIIKAGDLLDGLNDEQLGQMGHDLWLTIAGHGAGFWDGDWPINGDKITELLEDWINHVEVYVGDDNKIYVDVSVVGDKV